jgi:hypothetical protein
MRTLPVFFFATALLSTTLVRAQGYNPEMIQKVNEEIRFNEDRARALDPIIARNVQARNDMNTDVAQLRDQAKGMFERARMYRDWAARTGGRHHEHLARTADELDRNGHHNEELANTEQDLAGRLQGLIVELQRTQAWHREVAQRWRESLGW